MLALRSALLALGLLALFAGWAGSQQPPDKSEPPSPNRLHSPDPSQKPSPSNQTAAQPPIVINVLPTPKSESEKEEERREKQEKAETDRKIVDLTAALAEFTEYLFYATVALGVVGALTMVVLVWQGRQMKKTVDLARAEFMATHRPEMIVREVAWASQELDGGIVMNDGAIAFTVVNKGRNSGTIVESAIELRSGPPKGIALPSEGLNILPVGVNLAAGQFHSFEHAFAGNDLLGGRHNRIGAARVKKPEFAIDLGGDALDERKDSDHR